jgi:Ca2+-binding RTX toxin-like protein
MIELASSDPAFIAFGIPIQSLYDALKPARDAFVGWLNTVIPASEPKILATAINPAAIYYLAEGEKHVIDARGDDTGGNGIEKNIIVGNSASNMLFGGIGDDTLVGMDGDDVIFGGGGANTLYGGIGNDTYMIDLRDGIQSHRIIDTDGSNKIIVIDANGVAYNTIVLQQVSGQNIWIDSKGFVTAKHNSPWQIDLPDGSTIQLSDSALMSNAELSAAFGITLLDTPAASVNTFTGDFIKALEANQLNYKTSANGYVSAGVLPSAADLIVGTIANDVILGLGGNDALAGGDGADSIDGGDGADAIQGGRGADTLLGGAGDDFIFGSGDGALSRPLVRNFTPRASSGVEIARGFDWVVYNPLGVDENGFDGWTIEGIGDPGPNGELESNYIDGGAGNDEIFSGSANDVSYGGLGDDTLRGMAGSDALYGDDGNDNIEGDGTPLAGYLDATADAQNGNDALNGGAGNDILRGQGGDDELFGGIGADTLLGDAHDTTITIHGSDYLDGGDGADSMEGGGRDDVLFGGTGNDTLFGDAEEYVFSPPVLTP